MYTRQVEGVRDVALVFTRVYIAASGPQHINFLEPETSIRRDCLKI